MYKRSSEIMRESEALRENIANVVTGISLLTVFIVKDNGRYMTKCSELAMKPKTEGLIDRHANEMEADSPASLPISLAPRKYTRMIVVRLTSSKPK